MTVLLVALVSAPFALPVSLLVVLWRTDPRDRPAILKAFADVVRARAGRK